MIKGIVILGGPDAAGKTTLAEKLIEMNHEISGKERVADLGKLERNENWGEEMF